MTYKDVVFEMFESATAELEKGNVYSANVLLWACRELLCRTHGVAQGEHLDWLLDLWFNKYTDEQLEQAFNILQSENRLPEEIDSIDALKSKLKRAMIKENPINLDEIKKKFNDCYEMYNNSKHGSGRGFGITGLDKEVDDALDPQVVKMLHQMVSYYIDSIYTKDIIEKYGLEYMDEKYGSPKN